jgi:hypothetical protein
MLFCTLYLPIPQGGTNSLTLSKYSQKLRINPPLGGQGGEIKQEGKKKGESIKI